MLLVLILYLITLASFVAALFLAWDDGAESGSGIRSTVAALLCLACMWANWYLTYNMIQDNQTCETSTEIAD